MTIVVEYITRKKYVYHLKEVNILAWFNLSVVAWRGGWAELELDSILSVFCNFSSSIPIIYAIMVSRCDILNSFLALFKPLGK